VVTVADAGKPYNATIKTVNTDGTFDLSFGTEKPPVARRYKKDEVRVVKASDPTAPKTAADKLNATKPTVTTMGASTSLGSPGAVA